MAEQDKAKKQAKPKKTKEEKAQIRKERIAYFKWRIGVAFTGEKGIEKLIEKAVSEESTKKLNVILNNHGFKTIVGNRMRQNLTCLVWEEASKQKKESLYSFLLNHKEDPGMVEKRKSWSQDKDIQPGQHVLLYAVNKRNTDLVQAIKDADVDLNFSLSGGSWGSLSVQGSPMSNAAKVHDLEMMTLLYENGVRPGHGAPVTSLVKDIAAGRSNQDSQSCLDLALAQGVNLDHGDGELLRIAARAHDDETFQKLLDAGADIELSYRYAQSEPDTVSFMHSYVEKSRTGWHVIGDDLVMKVSYSPKTDTRVREVFNFESETVTTQVNESAPSQIPFNQVAQKQIAKATEKKTATITQDNTPQQPKKKAAQAAAKK